MQSPGSDRSEVSVEGLIDRFRHGLPLHARSPRRTPTRRPTLDGIIAQDIHELDAIIEHGRTKEPMRRPIMASPASHVPMLHRTVSVEDDIAAMLLHQQQQQQSTQRHEPVRPATADVHVSASTADVIRNTGIAIDRDMAQALASFQQWEASRTEIAPSPEAQAVATLPLSALTIATELDAAFELLNKKAKEYPKPDAAPVTKAPSAEAAQAKSIVQGHAVASARELHATLERLEQAAETAAATSPQLDHIVRSQAMTDDHDLRAILARINMVAPIAPTLLFPPAFSPSLEGPHDPEASLIDELQRLKAMAAAKTHAIEEAYAPLSPPPRRRCEPDSPRSSDQGCSSSIDRDSNNDDDEAHAYDDDEAHAYDDDGCNLASLALHSRAIVEDLSVAMYTLRHRLDCDAKEQRDRDENELREKDARAKAKTMADAAKAKAKSEANDLIAAKERVMGMTSCQLAANDDSDDVFVPAVNVDPRRDANLPPAPRPWDDAVDVLQRFDALLPPMHNSNQDDDRYVRRQPFSFDPDAHETTYNGHRRRDAPRSFELDGRHAWRDDEPAIYKEARHRDYSGLSIDELKEARERKLRWLFPSSSRFY
ncbi:hypothetical protein SDRG_05757 [Saprolegnia diclina VS20]|uniref:Uncharacterized protein n=1 Tax=Saprolegnia diclina (strain VS20) TaxID=1156394 RepID=T0QQB3_SAPDV|nr:hypothetical protein SDRG_05757 [Saprolegnia diclina VS20]EQC36931.1 hypothetical protein SDRG_05757 [Saprolegnia diclina VS20]|eukprot:XP_008609712.1 hypothetical protein SDRG_05757 [Saprolegnia diclina VS20]